MREPTGARSASDAGGLDLKASNAVNTFFIRVAISLFRALLYCLARSATLCLLKEFCLASTTNAEATIPVRQGGGAAIIWGRKREESRMKFINVDVFMEETA